jgi:two-component sensor histidine kinase
MSTSTPLASAPPQKTPRNAISRKQVDVVLSRSVAAGSLLFSAQMILPLLSQYKEANVVWTIIIVTSFALTLFAALLCSIIVRWVRTAMALNALVLVVGLITWPFAVLHPHTSTDGYWLYYLLNVGTSMATIAFSTRLASVYLVVTPLIYGVVRVTQAGGSEQPLNAALDSIYAVILGGAVVVLVTMLRQTATAVDLAQSAALERYGHAVRHHATEVERVQVDSIVHDSVLTTLISAARAYTPETKELAAGMAANAIGYLHDAALVQPDDGSTTRLRLIVKRISDAAAGMVPPFRVTVRDVGPRSIPANVAEAISSAAMQAMYNSLQHGGLEGVDRWVTIHAVRGGGMEVEVGDTGRGFSLESVPTERLGVRVSIIERVANAGGLAKIVSSPGNGTVVTVRWPSPKSATGPIDQIAAELLGPGEFED